MEEDSYEGPKRELSWSTRLSYWWKHNWKGVFGLLGAFCIHLIIGILSRWAMINEYVTSFYKIYDQPKLTINENMLVAPASFICHGLTMEIGYQLSCKVGTLIVLLVGVIGIASSIAISSFMPTFTLFFVFHNLVYGLFAGLLFLPPMKECHRQFPSYTPFVNAFILLGTGFGTFLFGTMNLYCINPENYPPDFQSYYILERSFVALRVPRCVNQMAIWCLAIGILGVSLLSFICFDHRAKDLQRYKSQKYIQSEGSRPDFQYRCHSTSEAIDTRVFWVIALLIALSSAQNFFITLNYKNFLVDDNEFLYENIIFLSGAFGNAVCRLPWGFSYSRIGFRRLFTVAMIFNVIVAISLPMTVSESRIYIVPFILSGVTLGGLTVIMPNLCMKIYGSLGDQIYGYHWFSFSIGNLMAYATAAYLTPRITIKYNLYLFGIVSLICIPIAWGSSFKAKWSKQDEG